MTGIRVEWGARPATVVLLVVLLGATGCSGGPGAATSRTGAETPSASDLPFTPPPTEPTGPSSPSTTRPSDGGTVIVVGGPTLGTNYPGSWGNWGVTRFEASTGPVPVGADGPAFTGDFFAPSSHRVSVVAVVVMPEEGPFRLLSTGCVGAVITGPSPGEGESPPAGVTGCRVAVGFRPRHPAPARSDSPDQGYFRGAVAFTLIRQCVTRRADPCSRIPASMAVSDRHPVRVRWTRTVALHGATECAPGQDACSGNGWSPTATPEPNAPEPGTSPTSSPSSGATS